MKHAEATKALVEFSLLDNNILTVKISDNGKGFVPQAKKSGIGLRTIRDRSSGINANINIDSEIGIGTRIELSLSVVDQLYQEL